VTQEAFATAAGWSYGIAAAGYLLFALRAAIGVKRTRGTLLLGALAATAAWSAISILRAVDARRFVVLADDLANALRYAFWFAFVGVVLVRPKLSDPAVRLPPRVVIPVALALVASVTFGGGLPSVPGVDPRMGYALHLVLAVLGLIVVEQLYRRVEPPHRWGIKPLVVALVGVFSIDLVLYADAMLYARLDADIWLARGFANVVVIPFIAIATARNTNWSIDLHLSRQAMFHSSALLISGVALLLVAMAGYVVRFVGGDWGRALEIELLFVATLFALLVAASGRFRAKLKVFVSTHFFSYRYDYREERLRFTRTLATQGPLLHVQERTIVALANLVESPAGGLWLRDESRGFVQTARWNVPSIEGGEPLDGPLAAFLGRTGWIVGLDDMRADPGQYDGLALPPWLDAFPSAWLIVPLASSNSLLGFVVLARPRTPIDVDWEVRDLLKTASRQAASFLGEIRASDALLEARKFDAFNRMSAFVVHDLKNLIAQLSLMLKNAERHRDNPEFQADMLGTIQNVVVRMNQLMLQLRSGTTPVDKPHPVDLAAVARRVCAGKAGARRGLECEARVAVYGTGHDDRLDHVVSHIVQNAIEATDAAGNVSVRAERDGGHACIVVSDDGAGMTEAFVRERLFKPFQTTKASGMGIGMYESAQYVASLGGDILVESALGAGTTVRLRLPLAVADGEEATELKEETA
jgi:putative PEP-CTERM system histidine kinase